MPILPRDGLLEIASRQDRPVPRMCHSTPWMIISVSPCAADLRRHSLQRGNEAQPRASIVGSTHRHEPGAGGRVVIYSHEGEEEPSI